jgi:biopolymer transport protein ExbB
MSITEIIYYVRDLVYMTQAAIGLFSAYLLILMMRNLSKKRFPSQAAATRFLDQVRDALNERNLEAVADLCDSPPYWSKAVPQLILVALQNLHLGPAKLRRFLGETFERDVLSEFDLRASWIVTVVKSAPMLGLLGTVLALIAAFEKVAGMQQTGSDPSALAGDIGHALLTTAFGLVIAVPLTLLGNYIHVKVERLQLAVQRHLTEFLDAYEAAFRVPGGKVA